MMLREWEAKTAEGDRCAIRKLNENGPNYPFVVPEIGKISFFNDWRKMQRFNRMIESNELSLLKKGVSLELL